MRCFACSSSETQRQQNTVKHLWELLCQGYRRKPQILIGRNKQAFHLILAAGSKDLAVLFFFSVASIFKQKCLFLFPALSHSNIFFPEWRKLYNEGTFPHLFGKWIFFLTLSVQTNIAYCLDAFSFCEVISAPHWSPVIERAVRCAASGELKFSNASSLFIGLQVKMFNSSNRKGPSLLP